jgi:hypothetical protein
MVFIFHFFIRISIIKNIGVIISLDAGFRNLTTATHHILDEVLTQTTFHEVVTKARLTCFKRI